MLSFSDDDVPYLELFTESILDAVVILLLTLSLRNRSLLTEYGEDIDSLGGEDPKWPRSFARELLSGESDIRLAPILEAIPCKLLLCAIFRFPRLASLVGLSDAGLISLRSCWALHLFCCAFEEDEPSLLLPKEDVSNGCASGTSWLVESDDSFASDGFDVVANPALPGGSGGRFHASTVASEPGGSIELSDLSPKLRYGDAPPSIGCWSRCLLVKFRVRRL